MRSGDNSSPDPLGQVSKKPVYLIIYTPMQWLIQVEGSWAWKLKALLFFLSQTFKLSKQDRSVKIFRKNVPSPFDKKSLKIPKG